MPSAPGTHTEAPTKRRPGRPPSYVFDKPDAELTDLERRLKLSVIKRRLRQNRSYHRRKAAASGGTAPACPPSSTPSATPSSALSSVPRGAPTGVPSTTRGQPLSIHSSTPDAAVSKAPSAAPLPPQTTFTVGVSTHQPSTTEVPPHVSAAPVASQMSQPLPDIAFAPAVGAGAARSSTSPSPFAAGEALAAVAAAAWVPQGPDAPPPPQQRQQSALGSTGGVCETQPTPEHSLAPPQANGISVFGLDDTTERFGTAAAGEVDAGQLDLTCGTGRGSLEGTQEGDDDIGTILGEMLAAETSQSIIRSSSTMMRMSSSSVTSSLSMLSPAARAGAHALAFFPHAFDACAAAAMLGRNVSALVPLMENNLLVVAQGKGSSGSGNPRFLVNPIVKHMLPAVRAQEEMSRRLRLRAKAKERQRRKDAEREKAMERARSLAGNRFVESVAAGGTEAAFYGLQDDQPSYQHAQQPLSGSAVTGDSTGTSGSDSSAQADEALAAALEFTRGAFHGPDSGKRSRTVDGDVGGDSEDEDEDMEDSYPPSDKVLRARYVAHFGNVLASLSENPKINSNGTERLRAMRTFDTDRQNLLHAMDLSESMGSEVHFDFLRKGAPVMRYCTDAKTRLACFQNAISSAADVAAGGGVPPVGIYSSGTGLQGSAAPSNGRVPASSERVEPGRRPRLSSAKLATSDADLMRGQNVPSQRISEDSSPNNRDASVMASSGHASNTAHSIASGGGGVAGEDGVVSVKSEDAASTPQSLERTSKDWLLQFGAGYCPELAARAAENAERSLSEASKSCRRWKNQARVHLALGEAFFDMLDMEKAEGPLMKARDLLDARSRRSECNLEAVDLALPNLLLAEIKASKGDLAEAKRLLYYALSTLSQAGLSESTFTVNAMNTLVGVHIKSENYDEAMWTCTRMVDVLSNMGGGSYRGMPIYADALGTLATVHLHVGQPQESERLFCEALEVIHGWLGRDGWHSNAPFEHCQDLDIWLMEGLARACRDQGKISQADNRFAEAMRKRRERGLAEGDGLSFSTNGSPSSSFECAPEILGGAQPGATASGPNMSGLIAGLDGMESLIGSGSSLDVAVPANNSGDGITTGFDKFSLGAHANASGYNQGMANDYNVDAFFSNPGMMNLKAGFPQQGLPVVAMTQESVEKNQPYPRHIY